MTDLKLGSTLLIKPAGSLEQNPEFELTSTFETMLPDNHILFSAPIHKGILYPLPLNETLFVSLTDQNGRYDFQCLVVDRPIQNNVHFIKARLLSAITLSQRRNYFRVKKTLKGKLTIERLVADGTEIKVRKVISQCLTHDISGGGVALYTNGHYEKDEVVTVSLPIGPDEDIVDLKAKVVWVTKRDQGNYNFFIGMEFLYEDRLQREDVVRYVFELQYEMLRQKRMLENEDD